MKAEEAESISWTAAMWLLITLTVCVVSLMVAGSLCLFIWMLRVAS